MEHFIDEVIHNYSSGVSVIWIIVYVAVVVILIVFAILCGVICGREGLHGFNNCLRCCLCPFEICGK